VRQAFACSNMLGGTKWLKRMPLGIHELLMLQFKMGTVVRKETPLSAKVGTKIR
jgi:hypothetical protein